MVYVDNRSTGELYHYGVKGMKWGVRKTEYKAMTRAQRKATRKKYRGTPEGKITRATTIGTLLGGPLAGVIAGSIANKKYNSGKKFVSDNANKKVTELAAKTESKKVAGIKSRVTGRKENGKPAFLMSQEEMADFSSRYERRRKTLSEQYRNATDEAAKQRIRNQYDRLENDYLSVVEQDFWYSDD